MPTIGRIRTPGRGPNGPMPIDARKPISGGLGVGAWQPPNPATLTTVRYVRKTGSDANGGTSPSDAWLTVTKALQTASPGSVIYVGAGTYRETVQVTITPTSLLPVALIGDIDGAFTGDVGMVQLTAYTTNDTTAPSATTLLDLNGKSNLTFRNIFFVGGSTTLVTATTLTSQNISFFNCAFLAGANGASGLISAVCAYSTPYNWRIDRCSFFNSLLVNTGSTSLTFGFNTGVGGGDYDGKVLISNCISHCGAGNFVGGTVGGASAGQGGGVRVRNCTVIATRAVITNSGISVIFPFVVTNCFFAGAGALIQATTSGQIIEDYNLLQGTTARTNVTAGPHSISDNSRSPLIHFGQEATWGANLRPFGEPLASSPLSAFGGDGVQTPYDIRGGPRPTGILVPAVGAFERGNNFVKETATVHTGTNAISVIGDGFYDFYLPVDAGARTVSIFCRVDSSYSGPAPRIQIVPNEEIGVGDPRADGTPAGVGAFEQISVTVNPTASGVLIVRVIASDVSGVGKTIFDTIAVA